jgi:type I restriction-modification system DNA methylase subunit
MAALHPNLRKKLEKTVVNARDIAEKAAQDALQALAVDNHETFPHMNTEQRDLRRKLRAHGRAIGDTLDAKGRQGLYHLSLETAYQHWHRMLFARFLAENNLLMHPDGVPVTLDECEELAAEEGLDKWELASRYAAKMLPAIFRPDDPTLQIEFAPEDKLEVEKLIADLEPDIFIADDSLGWVYQFWQSKKKDEVNRSGKKIGADELPAVTQLFTEDYMVKFLLHNSLGAWWAGKFLAANPKIAQDKQLSEDDLRKAVAFDDYNFEYLRFIFDEDANSWMPAAGFFEGWPKEAKVITVLDPSCGSGHFLVAAFELMVRVRMAEEDLPAIKAVDMVLKENLFGLEIEVRCTQIAALALAFAAWKFPKAEGFREFPQLNIACSGIPVAAKKEDWLKLANSNEKLKNGMDRLWTLFRQAPVLGSLIDPIIGDKHELIEASFNELQPLLEKALESEKIKADFDLNETAVVAKGIAHAAELLAKKYTLVITNVPYLKSGNHGEELKKFCAANFPKGKADLATVFFERCMRISKMGSTSALVIQQYWLFLGSYKRLREATLKKLEWNMLVKLGPAAFQTISGHVVNVCLQIISNSQPNKNHLMAGIDATKFKTCNAKQSGLLVEDIVLKEQSEHLKNPDYRITIEGCLESESLLSKAATFGKGSVTGDSFHYLRKFWEVSKPTYGYKYWLNSPNDSSLWSGREHIVIWDLEGHDIASEIGHAFRGERVWGQRGIAIGKAGKLRRTYYTGEIFDDNLAVIVPLDDSKIEAICAFCESDEFEKNIRLLDSKLSITAGTFVKVPFDYRCWQKVADEKYPDGLPEPYSEDPTQWIYKGTINDTTEPLQIAVARLLGYSWPEQTNDPEIDELVDEDGIVCIGAVGGEQPAADRLRAILASAFGNEWSPAKESDLLTSVEARKGLEDWLRNKFFEQHYKLFHHRPFIWHIWDGERDGFAALVNYHKLDKKLLETLTYSYLGDWINKQKADSEAGVTGADVRMLAAQILQKKLQLILRGEKPFDIFVRWKPIEEQPIGWEPDLNDGVRMNIRPFCEADILRKKPNIKWTKDRGKEPTRPKKQDPWFWDGDEFTGERVNDVHLSLQEKQEARKKAAKEAVK